MATEEKNPSLLFENLPANYKKTFSIFTNLLKCIGIDIFAEKLSAASKVRLLIFNLFFLPFTCVQIYLVFQLITENFLEGVTVIPMVLMFTLDVIKMITALRTKDEMRSIFMEIGELWPKHLGDDKKRRVLKTWLRRQGILVKSFFIYAVVNLVIFDVIPILATCHSFSTGANEYIFPFKLPNLWIINSTAVFVATYALEIAATTPCLLCLYLPYDLLIVTTTTNVSILLRLLQIDLQNSVKARHGLEDCDAESYVELVRIVKAHQRILSIVEKLNSIFGLVIFIHIGFSSMLICVFGFLTVVFGGVAETIANLLTVFSAIISIFLPSISGQLLCDTSSDIADAAYNSLWYESDSKVKKLVLFIIVRSQRTCYLSALGYTNMSLRGFSKIISSAWTYFSMLIQLYEEN